jgi:hypothetical protein
MHDDIDEDAPTKLFVPGSREPRTPADPRTTFGNLWDANDVARYLKVSRSWVYHRAEAGLLACVRIGSLLRFDPDVIRALAHGNSGAGAVSVRGSHPRHR